MPDQISTMSQILNDYLEKLKFNFWKRVEKTDSCWNWIGSINKMGYGMIGRIFDRKCYLAHRLSWIFQNQSIPEKYFICHKCDNRKCVNPDHLYLGTSTENFEDMWNKQRGARGEDQWKSKLTESMVREIRNSYIPRKTPAWTFAKKYGMSVSAIRDVIYRRVWKHI